jgi:DNA-binding winged helix-turn-helix (wHTH) protein
MTTPDSPSGLVRFGVFELDLKTGELRKNGVKMPLQEQPFQVLTMLIERPGELVTREELRARLWADAVFVDFDQGLGKAVWKIRRALGDLADSPRFVETLERRGYRFIAPVERVQQAGGRGSGLVVARLVGDDSSIPLAEGAHSIGRDPACAVWIDSSFVSRRHARIVVKGERISVEDLGSHNGTHVNGERISGPRTLADGDEIRVGPARLILYLGTGGSATVTAPR